MGLIEVLPNEISTHICTYLNPAELVTATFVCRALKCITDEDHLWKNYIIQKIGLENLSFLESQYAKLDTFAPFLALKFKLSKGVSSNKILILKQKCFLLFCQQKNWNNALLSGYFHHDIEPDDQWGFYDGRVSIPIAFNTFFWRLRNAQQWGICHQKQNINKSAEECARWYEAQKKCDWQLVQKRQPLLNAVLESDSPQIFPLLVQSGITLDDSRAFQMTQAFHFAGKKYDRNTLQLLLDKGADINVKDQQQRTLLQKLIETHLDSIQLHGEHLKTIQFLIMHNASCLEETELYTPLHAAASRSLAIARMLLKARVPVDITNREGLTPMHIAARNNFPEMMELLFLHKANINAESCVKQTPLHFALSERKVKAALILITWKANCRAIDSFKHSPLYYAFEQGLASIIKALLRAGASIEEEVINGIDLEGAAKKGKIKLSDYKS